jgi:hypothetical protein
MWRPDLKLYSAVILEEVPASTPYDPPYINETLSPRGGFLQPITDAFASLNGGLLASMHSGKDTSSLVCQLFGAGLLDSKQFGWVVGYRRGKGGAIERVMSDNGTGLINGMQVRC